jgi:hypothetical protein
MPSFVSEGAARRARAALVAGGLVLFSSGALAQENQPFRLDGYEFLERQYMLVSPQKITTTSWSPQTMSPITESHTLGFEGQVGPHVPLFGGALDENDLMQRSHFEWRFIFTFQTYLRLTTANSAPVLTPSYMPRFDVQVLGRRAKGVGQSATTDLRYGLTLELWGHHSNGQDGCTFTGPTPAGKACPELGDGALGINERNGSFATDYTGLTFVVRKSWVSGETLHKLDLLGHAGVQVHHNFPGGGLGTDPDGDLSHLWGRWHGHVEGEARWNPTDRADGWLGYLYVRGRLDAANGGHDARLPSVEAEPLSYLGEVGAISAKLEGVGLFLRAVGGREYYNIEFTQSPWRFQLGIVIDTSGNIPPIGRRPIDRGPSPLPPDDKEPSRGSSPPSDARPWKMPAS